jgi:hypothetical protein
VTAVKQAVQGVMAAYSNNPSEVERPDMTAPHDNNDNNNSERSKVSALPRGRYIPSVLVYFNDEDNCANVHCSYCSYIDHIVQFTNFCSFVC